MKYPLIILAALAGASAEAQTETRLGELRSLLQQEILAAGAGGASAAASAPAQALPRQLSPEERAQLRQQLSDFYRGAAATEGFMMSAERMPPAQENRGP